MKSKRLWLVVADGSRARILSRNGANGALAELEHLDNAAARAHTRDLVTDGQGRTFDSGGQGRHAMEPSTDPKDHEKIEFLDHLAERINAAVAKDKLDELVVMAPATALGRLRDKLSKQASRRIAADLGKDLTGHTVRDLEERLKDLTRPWKD